MTTKNMLHQIERACAQIADNGEAITFVAVAKFTDIARSTLYRNQTIRSVAEHHRRNAPDDWILVLTDGLTTLRATIKTIATKVRHHDAQLRRLEKPGLHQPTNLPPQTLLAG